MPGTLAARVTRENGARPEVKSLRLDTDFHAIDPDQFVAQSTGTILNS